MPGAIVTVMSPPPAPPSLCAKIPIARGPSAATFALTVSALNGSARGDSAPRTWLYGISLRVAKTWRRRRQLVPLGDDERAVAPLQEQERERRDAHELLCWALDQISEMQREVFVLHEIEELPMGEVAARVECGLFTAYSRLRLARRSLKRALAEKGVTR